MFVHWGLYSLLCRDAWAMGDEDIPLDEYALLAKQFQPKPNAAREWATLARKNGMKYMVMTAKHHEGFCLFDSQLTGYCARNKARAVTWSGSMSRRPVQKACVWVCTIRSWTGTILTGCT